MLNVSHQIHKELSAAKNKLKGIDEALSQENIISLIGQWKHFWMTQNQNSEEDRINYFRRAVGIDANMKHNLASRIRSAFLEILQKKG